MSLTMQSLATAYYAQDQITAYYLAQEGIEVVRYVRDGNILKVANGQTANLLDGIPNTNGQPFTVDTTAAAAQAMQACSPPIPAGCPPLTTDDTSYGYTTGNGWHTSKFTRYVEATVVASNAGVPEEILVASTVSWQSGNIKHTFTINEDMYRWVMDSTAN